MCAFWEKNVNKKKNVVCLNNNQFQLNSNNKYIKQDFMQQQNSYKHLCFDIEREIEYKRKEKIMKQSFLFSPTYQCVINFFFFGSSCGYFCTFVYLMESTNCHGYQTNQSVSQLLRGCVREST